MEITHLGIFLDVKSIVHISSNAQSHRINSNHPISLWALEHMQLDNIFLRCGDNPKLAEPHLEHHIFPQQYLLPYHNKCSSCGSNIPEVKFGRLVIDQRTFLMICDLLFCFQH